MQVPEFQEISIDWDGDCVQSEWIDGSGDGFFWEGEVESFIDFVEGSFFIGVEYESFDFAGPSPNKYDLIGELDIVMLYLIRTDIG